MGQSTVVGIGGGPLWGLTQADIIELFERDNDTEGIILLGEIGGSMEEEAAAYIKKSVKKPVVALIVGRHAPEGKRMGHAGAIISKHRGRAEDKVKALAAANVNIVKEPRAIPAILKKMI
jgi:succinyl-CoA synthetase alpha subunit